MNAALIDTHIRIVALSRDSAHRGWSYHPAMEPRPKHLGLGAPDPHARRHEANGQRSGMRVMTAMEVDPAVLLAGKSIVITGAGSGVGRAAAAPVVRPR